MARPRTPDHPAAQIRKLVADWRNRNDTTASMRRRLLAIADSLDGHDDDIEDALAQRRLTEGP
jgi:hypothetical protein